MHAALTLTRVNKLGQSPRHIRAPQITQQPTWEMNTFGRMTFTLRPNDPDAAAVVKYDEVVLTYLGTPIWWGVVVSKEVTWERGGTSAVVTFQCADLLWYFSHRYVGKASRTNYALDPNFEADPGDPLYGAWATVGTITFTRDGTRYKLNGRSAKIVSASANEDWYIYEDIIAFTATGVGDLLTISGWFLVEDAGFIGPAFGNWGMALVAFDGGVPSEEPPAVVHINPTATGRTPRGSWQYGRAKMWLPPDAIRDLQVRLYAVGGTIRFGAIQVVRMESLSSVTSATDFTGDMAYVMEILVQHAQDPSVGKDDLNIDTDCPDVGVRIERHYQYVDHALILQALQEFPAMGGPDFWIDWTPPASPGGVWTRTFHTAMPRGTARGLTYRLGPRFPWTKSFRHLDDGDRGISSITLLGYGDGPDREEAGVIDTSGTSGLIVEDVLAAPVSTDIDALQGVADQEFAVRAEPDTWGTVVYRPDWIAVLRPGDTVPLDYDVAASTTYQDAVRIVSVALDTTTLDLAMVLNRPGP